MFLGSQVDCKFSIQSLARRVLKLWYEHQLPEQAKQTMGHACVGFGEMLIRLMGSFWSRGLMLGRHMELFRKVLVMFLDRSKTPISNATESYNSLSHMNFVLGGCISFWNFLDSASDNIRRRPLKTSSTPARSSTRSQQSKRLQKPFKRSSKRPTEIYNICINTEQTRESMHKSTWSLVKQWKADEKL